MTHNEDSKTHTDNAREVNKDHPFELRTINSERDGLRTNCLPTVNALPHLRLYLLPQTL